MSAKSEGYFEADRSDALRLWKRGPGRVLDVGCGAGVTGSILKERFQVAEVWGLEMVESAARVAQGKLQKVLVGSIEDPALRKEIPRAHFDAVLFFDVLEHLVDPWAILREARQWLTADGVVLASIPNVRHFRTLFPLFFSGEFRYVESGTLDSTHLRFFTRKSVVELFERAGFEVEEISSTGRDPGSKTRMLNAITFGLFSEFFDFQYLIRARKRPDSFSAN